ncbi:C-type lectin domain family 4 member M-like [Engraulis encrasicolus]|uniref:C-type lectin domain family 4 member M-like n=1 Tax=Engraulis encrasicolus TaxID=184585 RepID=UPI002FD09229
MSPVREIKQRLFLSAKFLISLNLLFLLFVIILGILFSSEKKAHQVTSQSLRDLNISYVKVQGEKTSLEKDLNVSRGEAKALTTKYNSLSQEKTSLQAELKSVWSSWRVEITKTERLTREKNSKVEELDRKRTELIKRDETITQLRQSNTKISQDLEETNKNLNEQKRNNTLWSHLKESIEKEMKEYKDKQPSQIRDQEKTFLDSLLQVLETGCDFTWELAGGKCFFFSSEKHTWEQSRDDCQAKKGELAFTPTETEWEILKKAIPGNSKDFYWIGLTDSDTEGSWRWVDNKTITINHWLNNDPDNWTNNDTKPEGENCAKMNAVEGGWMDAFCDEQIPYICQTMAAV